MGLKYDVLAPADALPLMRAEASFYRLPGDKLVMFWCVMRATLAWFCKVMKVNQTSYQHMQHAALTGSLTVASAYALAVMLVQRQTPSVQ